MKRKIVILGAIVVVVVVVILILIILLTMILFKEDYSFVNVQTSEIMNNISTTLEKDFPPMLELDDLTVNDTYGIDTGTLESYIIKIPIMNIRADEIAIVKVKEIKDIGHVVKKFNERVLDVQKTFEHYLDDQYNIAKNPLVVAKGNYVLMSISEKNETIENIFNSYFVSND